MPTIETVYLGELRTKAVHLASGNTLITDAPVDNQGKGEAFSPTDLLAASLGSCMLTIMGIAARTHGVQLEGLKVEITKIMRSDPRRIGEIQVVFHMNGMDVDEHKRMILERAARTCPVSLSLHPDLIQSIEFNW
jgi:putative redox protein